MKEGAKHTKVYVQSFGCPSNLAEGESMAGCLSQAGYDIVGAANDADVLIYNTCVVKTPTENRMIEILKKGTSSERQACSDRLFATRQFQAVKKRS